MVCGLVLTSLDPCCNGIPLNENMKKICTIMLMLS